MGASFFSADASGSRKIQRARVAARQKSVFLPEVVPQALRGKIIRRPPSPQPACFENSRAEVPTGPTYLLPHYVWPTFSNTHTTHTHTSTPHLFLTETTSSPSSPIHIITRQHRRRSIFLSCLCAFGVRTSLPLISSCWRKTSRLPSKDLQIRSSHPPDLNILCRCSAVF